MAGLREIAESDLGGILEDAAYGFGYSITITNQAGIAKAFTGFSSDISQVIDPDTGVAVSGRLATIAIRLSSLYTAGFEIPKGIADAGLKPWVVEFDDINGLPFKFKVAESNPDRAIGMVTCILEAYK